MLWEVPVGPALTGRGCRDSTVCQGGPRQVTLGLVGSYVHTRLTVAVCCRTVTVTVTVRDWHLSLTRSRSS